jgi:kynurenine formamidase
MKNILSLLCLLFLADCEPQHPSSPAYANILTDEDIDRVLPQLSNWGKWGKDDQLGTLNYITPEVRTEAARLIRKGISVSLSQSTNIVRDSISRGAHEMNIFRKGSMDFIAMSYHGYKVTHVDGLCHFFADSLTLYNGYPRSVVTQSGAVKLGIESFAKGMSGRGVLLDMEIVKGRPLEPGEAIHPADLEEAEKKLGVKVGTGDILLVRTGSEKPGDQPKVAGLAAECMLWLHDRQVAMLGCADVAPAAFKRYWLPTHAIGIPHLGMPLLDNASLNDLSRTCQSEKRWEFFLTIAPLRLEGATGSPVNPIAIF